MTETDVLTFHHIEKVVIFAFCHMLKTGR